MESMNVNDQMRPPDSMAGCIETDTQQVPEQLSYTLSTVQEATSQIVQGYQNPQVP